MPSGFTSVQELSKQLTETRENVIEMSKGQSAGGKKIKSHRDTHRATCFELFPWGRGGRKAALASTLCPVRGDAAWELGGQ